MSIRAVARWAEEPAGQTLELREEEIRFSLFIPERWRPSPSGAERLCVHFHTVPWFAIQEHERRGAAMPLVVFALGEGSAVYAEAFRPAHRFGRVLTGVASSLQQRGALSSARIAAVDLSSFSAGYGAVRELVKVPGYFALIQRIVLLDSLYAGWEEDGEAAHPRRPRPDQIEVWVPFARAAVQGKKTFVLTHSAVPTVRYASTSDCANALLAALGIDRKPVTPESLPAARDPDCPLLSRAQAGQFHVWGYGGTDGPAHLTHVRHLADVWAALDETTARSTAPPPCQYYRSDSIGFLEPVDRLRLSVKWKERLLECRTTVRVSGLPTEGGGGRRCSANERWLWGRGCAKLGR